MNPILLLIALLMGCAASRPADGADEQIAFATLEFTEGAVAVTALTVVPGTLRRPREVRASVPPDMLLLVVTADGEEVWTDAVPDPLHRHVEYVDAEGALATRTEHLDRATVVVRLPAVAAQQQLAFYRLQQAVPERAAERVLVASVRVSL